MANTMLFGSIYMGKEPMQTGDKFPGGRPMITLGDMVPSMGIRWVLVNGLLIASISILRDASLDALCAYGLAEGQIVNIDGQTYRCRLLRVNDMKDPENEWEAALQAAGDEDRLWHWTDEPFWVFDCTNRRPTVIVRSNTPPARKSHVVCSNSDELWGWRPVLEPIQMDFSRFCPGDCLEVGGSKSCVSGQLIEITEYDLVLDNCNAANIALEEQFGVKLDKGRMVIDKSAVTAVRKVPLLKKEDIELSNTWLMAI